MSLQELDDGVALLCFGDGDRTPRIRPVVGPFFEFQLDAQGKVTGAVLEQQGPQGTQRTPLERK